MNPNSRIESPALGMDAQKPDLAVASGATAILLVNSAAHVSQIGNPVVGGIAVNVVNLADGPSTINVGPSKAMGVVAPPAEKDSDMPVSIRLIASRCSNSAQEATAPPKEQARVWVIVQPPPNISDRRFIHLDRSERSVIDVLADEDGGAANVGPRTLVDVMRRESNPQPPAKSGALHKLRTAPHCLCTADKPPKETCQPLGYWIRLALRDYRNDAVAPQLTLGARGGSGLALDTGLCRQATTSESDDAGQTAYKRDVPT